MNSKLTLSVVALMASHLPAFQTGIPGGATQSGPVRRSPVHLLRTPLGAAGPLQDFEELEGHPLPGSLPGDLSLVPFDVVGRTMLDALRTDRPRWSGDVPGAARVDLPGRTGTLYRYSRSAPGGLVFGHLLCRPDGRLKRLAERAGLGAGSSHDPFVAHVAVSADGRALLLATRMPAGGDLIEIDLESGRETTRSANLGPQAFSKDGLWLCDGWGFAVARTGVWRFDRSPGAQASALDFAGSAPPALCSGQAAVSHNGQWALISAGDSAQQLLPFVFDRFGPATPLDTPPGPISAAGYLPDHIGGPYCAVSDDGGQAAWVVEGLAREAFVAEVAAPPGQAAAQLTSDAHFLDTLDEVGVVDFSSLATLTLAVGARTFDAQEFIENADLFAVSLGAGGVPSFTNLSATSGDTQAPFLVPGSIQSSFASRLEGGLLLHDDDSETLFGLSATLDVLVDQVKSVEWAEAAGDFVLIALRRSFDPRPYQLWRVRRDLAGPAVLAFDGTSDSDFAYPVSDERGVIAYLHTQPSVGEQLERLDLPSLTRQLLPIGAASLRAPIGFSPLGALQFTSVTASGFHSFHLWPASGPVIDLQAAGDAGFFLPGE